MDQLVDFLLNFYGPTPYFLIFGILLACGLGLPIPEDITLFAAGLSAYYGLTDLWPTIGLCLFGVLLGDSVIFWFGRKFGRRFARHRLFSRMLSDERLSAVERKFNERGTRLIFVARFMPGLRAPIFFSAGLLRVPFLTFISFDGGAALVSVPLIVGAVYYFGDNIEAVVHAIQRLEHGILVVIGLVLAWLAFKWWKSRRRRAAEAGGEAV